MIAPILAFILFIGLLAIGARKYALQKKLYTYYQPSSNMYVSSTSKYDVHLLSIGFHKVEN